MNEDIKIVSNNIKAERIRKGLTQQEVADQLKISLRTYQRFEQDPNDVYTGIKLAKILGCKIENFYLGINTTECGTN